jgi:hypothetical protein
VVAPAATMADAIRPLVALLGVKAHFVLPDRSRISLGI